MKHRDGNVLASSVLCGWLDWPTQLAGKLLCVVVCSNLGAKLQIVAGRS